MAYETNEEGVDLNASACFLTCMKLQFLFVNFEFVLGEVLDRQS